MQIAHVGVSVSRDLYQARSQLWGRVGTGPTNGLCPHEPAAPVPHKKALEALAVLPVGGSLSSTLGQSQTTDLYISLLSFINSFLPYFCCCVFVYCMLC